MFSVEAIEKESQMIPKVVTRILFSASKNFYFSMFLAAKISIL